MATATIGAETDPARRPEFPAVRREIQQVRRLGYAVSMGTSMPGATALAILIPVPRDRGPMTLSVGGPMREVKRERDELAAILKDAIEPIRRASSA